MATINAASCGLSDIQTAIASASRGDTISVPAGSAIWNGKLAATKGVLIIGDGMYSTYITSNYTAPSGDTHSPLNALVSYEPDATAIAANEPFRLSGFNFDLANKCGFFMAYNSSATTNMNRVRIDNNYVTDKTKKGVYTNGIIGGVCDNNTFVVAGLVFGARARGADTWANQAFYFGNEYMMYFEDNVVVITDTISDGGAGGIYCIRYNTITHNGSADLSPDFDMHGNDPAAVSSGMITEIYGNTIIAATGKKQNGLNLRGGKGLYYNNEVTGGTGHRSYVSEEHLDTDGPGNPTDVDGNPQHVNDSYWFNNTYNGNLVWSQMPFVSGSLTDPSLGRVVPLEDYDYWLHKSTFDGTSGVGVGLLAARPSSGLTVGVGYWATDVLNDGGTYGVLYRATDSTTWETYYQPYEYPHPLRETETTGFTKTFDARLVVSESETARLYVEYPHVRVVAGTSATYTIWEEAYNDFTADITLDATGLPTNATDSYGTNPIAYNGSTTATIATTDVAAGTYSIYFTGTADGGEVGSVRVILEVVESDDCAPKVPIRRIRVKQGDSAVFTVMADPTSGYTGDMDLSASGVPSGASGEFAAEQIAYNESTTYTIDSGTAAVGEHEIVITGEGPV